MGLNGPHLRYPCRDPDQIYELYDDVEPTDDSRSSLKGKGLLVVGLDPASLGTWDTSAARTFLACCWCEACGHLGKSTREERVSVRSHQLLVGQISVRKDGTGAPRPVSMVWPGWGRGTIR